MYVEPDLHSRDESYLIIVDKLFDVQLQWFASILLKIFAFMFIMDIGLKVSFRSECLPGSGIRMMLVS